LKLPPMIATNRSTPPSTSRPIDILCGIGKPSYVQLMPVAYQRFDVGLLRPLSWASRPLQRRHRRWSRDVRSLFSFPEKIIQMRKRVGVTEP
jgi:hypothetical protein